TSKICVMANDGGSRRIVEETTVATTREGFSEYLAAKSRDWPVAFETGVHCRWMASHIRGMGFKVHVANPAKLRQLTLSNAKNDTNDARELARPSPSTPSSGC
ncbi:MAG: transposase, partial [Desulfovibrio sp.]|nr:transposase [Desulfovibrio sp.]